MNTQRDNTKVIIEKWRLDTLVEEAELCLKAAGKTVGSTAVAADYPDNAEEHTYALKDAADCYNAVYYLIEEMKRDIAGVKEIRTRPAASQNHSSMLY